MIVFASDQWLYTQVNKDDLGTTEIKNNEAYYYDIYFFNMLNEVKFLEIGGKSIEEVLESNNSYNGTSFSKNNNYTSNNHYSVYDYNGEIRPMVEFELSKNQDSNYNGSFKYRLYKKNQFNYSSIDQSYNIPAPTTNF